MWRNFSFNDSFSILFSWLYVETSLHLLQELKHALISVSSNNDQEKPRSVEPTLSSDSLSVTQQQHVSALLQFITALGIVPSLIPGVGLPMEKRSKFLQHVQDENASNFSIETVISFVSSKDYSITRMQHGQGWEIFFILEQN